MNSVDDREMEVAEAGSPGDPSDFEAFRLARARAEQIQGLYIHLFVYVLVNAALFLLNLTTRGDGGSWWFVWPAAIWGIGLAIHLVTVFVPFFSTDWPERRAARMVRREQ